MPSIDSLSDERISILTSTTHGGGAEFVARTWLIGLSARGFRVSLVTFAEHDTPLALENHIDITPAKDGHIDRVKGLRAYLLQARPTIVLSLLTYPNLLLLAAVATLPKSMRPKVVVSERNILTLISRAQGPAKLLQLHAARFTYRFADHVVAISHAVAGELVGGFNVKPDHLSIVPNPALSKPASIANTVHNPAADDEAFDVRLVIPGRIEAQKNPFLALLVGQELIARGTKAQVIFAGSGPLEEAVRARAAELKLDVRFEGWNEHWFAGRSRNTVVLLPSSYEGFGNVLVEAASQAIPVVASSLALGVADALVNGVTGYLASSLSPQDLADAVIAADRLPRITLDSWLERFSPDNSVSELLKVIDRVRN